MPELKQEHTFKRLSVGIHECTPAREQLRAVELTLDEHSEHIEKLELALERALVNLERIVGVLERSRIGGPL